MRDGAGGIKRTPLGSRYSDPSSHVHDKQLTMTFNVGSVSEAFIVYVYARQNTNTYYIMDERGGISRTYLFCPLGTKRSLTIYILPT